MIGYWLLKLKSMNKGSSSLLFGYVFIHSKKEHVSSRCRTTVRCSEAKSFFATKSNYIFSLGHFQWCICKYENGPCFDFSGGMFIFCIRLLEMLLLNLVSS